MSGPNGKGTDDAEDLLLAVRAGSPDVVVTGQGCSFLTLVFFFSRSYRAAKGQSKNYGGMAIGGRAWCLAAADNKSTTVGRGGLCFGSCRDPTVGHSPQRCFAVLSCL
jgi:hypothetical protein